MAIAPARIDRARITELTEREASALNERTPRSREMYERARLALAGGVASSYQLREPWPIYLERGEGARVWDVDGNEMLDFHNGFGSMTQGHAHDAISRAIEKRVRLGTHFAAPTEDAIVVAEELQRRWGLPKWRYTNSGTEATMDAIRIARAATGRDTVGRRARDPDCMPSSLWFPSSYSAIFDSPSRPPGAPRRPQSRPRLGAAKCIPSRTRFSIARLMASWA